MSLLPCMRLQQGVKQSRCPSVRGQRNIEKAEIRSEKGTITTFVLFWEGHSDDSVIYNLLELQSL